MNLKCTSYAFCFFALSLTSLSANVICQEKYHKRSACQEACDKPMWVTTQPFEEITPPQAPKVCGWANYFFTADFIYWKMVSDGYQFAAGGVPTNNNGNIGSPTSEGKSPGPDFDFQPGFKVGAGFKFAHDGWDLYANYTWLNPAKIKTQISSPDGHLVGPGDPYLSAPTLLRVKDTFQQSFNTLDLELGRQFFLSRFLTLRPYFGLKAMWIDQHKRDYSTVFNDISNGLVGGVSSVIVQPGNTITTLIAKQDVKSWGVGIRGGFAPVWYFMKDFGLYGNFAASCLWSSFKNHTRTSFKGFFTDPVTGAITPISAISGNIGRSFHTVTPVIEVGLGLTYMMFFHEDTSALTLSAGWEEQVWIGFNGGYPSGNLSLQGFTFKVGYEF
jgi:hypothetical protein